MRLVSRTRLNRSVKRVALRGQAITEYVLIIGLLVIPLAIAVNELADVVKDFLARFVKMLWGPGI